MGTLSYKVAPCSQCRLAATNGLCRKTGRAQKYPRACKVFDFRRPPGGLERLVERSLEVIKMFEPAEGYILAFSGGKDSIVLKHLAERAGVKFEGVYNWTSVDPPELSRFIAEHHPEVRIRRPKLTMFQLIVKKKIPPTRLNRYCCDHLKEHVDLNRSTLFGVRKEESATRKNRKVLNVCSRNGTKEVNPILDWKMGDVWQYIQENNLPYPSLYDEGFARLGCIGCPLSRKMRLELERYPKFKKAYRMAFDRMLEARKADGKDDSVNEDGTPSLWTNGEGVMRWWLRE